MWLKLLQIARQSRGFRWAFFAPLAQGTIRTISERAFFLSFFALFGMNPWPYHLLVLFTFACGLVLIAILTAKFTGSRAAGFWAAVLWAVHGSMGVALAWISIYYEVLCAVFLLASLWLLMRYAETGDTRFYAAQWVTFLAGFGVLELNVVYPAIAAVFALIRARHILGRVWPMFAASAAYTALHAAVAPFASEGVYKMHWDASIFSTFWTYWKWTVGPSLLSYAGIPASTFRSFLTVALMAGLGGFLAWQAWKREWISLFFAAWYVVVLGPLLPLRDHVDQYYLTVPLVGFAMWGAWAFISGWRGGVLTKCVSVALLGIYIGVSIPVARATSESFHDRGARIRSLVVGVAAQAEGRKNDLILLRGVDSEAFWSAIYHRPFALYGLNDVYLLPKNESEIVPALPLDERSLFYADPVRVSSALGQGRAIVLDVSGGDVRQVTAPPAR